MSSAEANLTSAAALSASHPQSEERLSRAVLVLIAICSLVYFLDGLIHSILGPLAPQMARSLSLTTAELGPIFSANLVGQCIGLVVLPLFVERIGQRGIVLVSLLGFGLAQSGSALADGATSLFVWRLVTGVFLGGCLPSCLAIVTEISPPKRRGLAIMTMFTGYGLGATVAGLVAAAFAGVGGWRAAMVGVGAVCGVAAIVAWVWLRLPPRHAAVRGVNEPDPATNVLRIVSPRYVVGTLMLWLLFISMLTISYCLNSWLPTLLVEVGRDQSFAALSVSIFSLGGIIAALGVGVLIDRFGASRTLVSFLAVSTALFFAIGQVLATASATALMVLLAVCGFFVLGAYGGVNVVLASYYPADLRAAGIGWTKSVGRVGTLVAPVLIGLGLGAGVMETTIMSLFAVPAFVAAACVVVIAIAARRAG
ncbi:MAG TPA: MFS transporter [Gammaproteobacteria bacterium]|jgi:MFS family permease|nr:MFS transporter [Gammaproteobacteria bacterium]